MKARRGGVFVVVAAGLTALAAAGALAVDMGMGVLERARLQNAADAAAIAASYHLVPQVDQGRARLAAIDWARRNGATIKAQDVSFGKRLDGKPWVEVRATKQVDTAFARMFGTKKLDVAAASAVALGAPKFPKGVMPFAVPAVPSPTGDWLVMNEDGRYEPLTGGGGEGCGDHGPTMIRLKAGSGGSDGGHDCGDLLGGVLGSVRGNFQAIAVDGHGASAYQTMIANGTSRPLDYGVKVATEPGNMAGPTAEGVRRRLASGKPDAAEAYVPLIAATEFANLNGRDEVTLIGVIRVKLQPPNGKGEVVGEYVEGVVGLPGSLSGPSKSPGLHAPVIIPPGQLKTALR